MSTYFRMEHTKKKTASLFFISIFHTKVLVSTTMSKGAFMISATLGKIEITITS